MPRSVDVTSRPAVVFLCGRNAGRSQMAAGWARAIDGERVDISSGGSEPATEVNPIAIEAMSEVGIDISSAVPKRWDEDALQAADVIITMGCGDSCPVVPGTRYEDWDVADPSGLSLEGVRPIRDEIERRVRGLLAEL
jgi:arsenate reductase (thioredoxin)